jgi:hypothetical protein
MSLSLRVLIKVQEHVIQCRRLAAETPDPKESRRIYLWADAVEAGAREVDMA